MGNSTTIPISVVGDVNTGKSTLVSIFTNKDYKHERYHSIEMGTMTIEYTTDINKIMYKLRIYDTSGASLKYFHSLQRCNMSAAVIVCFDIHTPDTYQRAKQWIHDIKEKHDPVIVLVGTYKAALKPYTISPIMDVQNYCFSNSITYHTVDIFLENYNEISAVFSSVITEVTHKTFLVENELLSPKLHENCLETFLQKHKLHQYTKYLKEQGYETMSDIYDMSWSDVVVLHMKRAHKKKLFRILGKSTQIKATNVLSVHLQPLKPLYESEKSRGPLNINIIILGDSGVGKTTLIKKLETNLFDEFMHATIGVEYHYFTTLSVHRKNTMKITLIDPTGMERYHSLTHQSYRDVHGAILVTDICNKQSWDHITFWRNQLKEHCNHDDIEVILLCHKMDKCLDDEKLSNDIIERATTYAQYHTFKNYNTSCKDELYGKQVRKAFEELVANIVYDNTLFRRLRKERQQKQSKQEDRYEPFGHLTPTLESYSRVLDTSSSIRVDGRLIPVGPLEENHRKGGRCNCNV